MTNEKYVRTNLRKNPRILVEALEYIERYWEHWRRRDKSQPTPRLVTPEEREDVAFQRYVIQLYKEWLNRRTARTRRVREIKTPKVSCARNAEAFYEGARRERSRLEVAIEEARAHTGKNTHPAAVTEKWVDEMVSRHRQNRATRRTMRINRALAKAGINKTASAATPEEIALAKLNYRTDGRVRLPRGWWEGERER